MPDLATEPETRPFVSAALFASVWCAGDHVTGARRQLPQVGRAGSAPAGHFATNRQARYMAGHRVEKGATAATAI
jgi:hypothetical protein